MLGWNQALQTHQTFPKLPSEPLNFVIKFTFMFFGPHEPSEPFPPSDAPEPSGPFKPTESFGPSGPFELSLFTFQPLRQFWSIYKH